MNQKSKIYLKIIIVALIQCFLFSSILFASSGVKDFCVPKQLGSVKEVFETTSGTGRTIIQIQDAHCNYEAQKNLAQILEYLVKEYNLKLVMVEGGSGDVSLSFLRFYSDRKTRQEVADKYLKMGKISGEEYLDIVSDYDIQLYGIEDAALYKANLDSFLAVESWREEGVKDLERLSSIVAQLKPKIYNPELSAFVEQRAGYNEKKISLTEYCRYLSQISRNKGLELSNYQHLTAFIETAQFEKEIDFKEAESQRNDFIKELGRLVSEKGLNELLSKSQDFKAGKMKPLEYYSFLKSLSENRVDIKKNYPQLDFYITYITLSQTIKADDLLKEIGLLEDEVKDKLFVNNDEKYLAQIEKSLRLLSKFLTLELSPQDYAYFQANRASFLTSSWINFLTDNCRKYNLSERPSASSVIDENFAKLEGFYQAGVARESAFINNITKKMDKTNEKLAVVITGGFHTPGITRLLKDRDYSYVVVAPLITKKGDSDIYFSVLRGEKERVEGVSIEE